MKRERGIGTRWMALAREIKLGELMKLLPDDEIVIIFNDQAGANEYREEYALFNGETLAWWKDKATAMEMHRMRVLGFRAWELEDTAGPVTMIVVDL